MVQQKNVYYKEVNYKFFFIYLNVKLILCIVVEFLFLKAKQILRRKQGYEKQRDNLYNQSYNISNIASTINNVNDTKETIRVMQG